MPQDITADAPSDYKGWEGLFKILKNSFSPSPVSNVSEGKIQRQALVDVKQQGQQAEVNAIDAGVLNQPALAVGLSQSKDPVRHAEELKRLATPVIRKKIQEGSITKETYIKHDLEAQNATRQAQGQPPMDQQEVSAHTEKAGHFWNQLGLDGKSALILGAALAGAVAFKDQPQYNEMFQQSYQSSLDRRNQMAALKAKMEAEQKQQAEQIKAQQGEGAANRASAEKIAAGHDKASMYSSDQRLESYQAKIEQMMEKQARMTPDQLETAIDNQLLGVGFSQYTDPKKKIVDPNFANAKGKLLTLFNAYRNSPKYKEASDGQLVKAIIQQHIVPGATQPAEHFWQRDKVIAPQYSE